MFILMTGGKVDHKEKRVEGYGTPSSGKKPSLGNTHRTGETRVNIILPRIDFPRD